MGMSRTSDRLWYLGIHLLQRIMVPRGQGRRDEARIQLLLPLRAVLRKIPVPKSPDVLADIG